MYPLRLLCPLVQELKLVSRCFAHAPSSLPKKKKPIRTDPNLKGIQRQIERMEYTPEQLEGMEDFDDEELNISVAESLLDDHYSERRSARRKSVLAMYGQKYYKPKKEPALLTWADMELIRHLHYQEKWPLDELAKSFPASEYIIQRIVKTSYKPTPTRIQQHDEDVAKNWQLLKKGKLDMSEELRQHCTKFTNRKVFPTISKDLVVPEKPDINVRGVFSSLLKKPEHVEKENESKNQTLNEIDGEETMGNIALMRRIKMKVVTLEEKRKRKLEEMSLEKPLSAEEKAFVCGTSTFRPPTQNVSNEASIHMSQNQEQSVNTKIKSTPEVFHSKWASSGHNAVAKRDAVMAPEDKFKEHITIPEALRKPGAIYRVEDCFYDGNGDFLYRVPGLKL